LLSALAQDGSSDGLNIGVSGKNDAIDRKMLTHKINSVGGAIMPFATARTSTATACDEPLATSKSGLNV
jgi:hypothetical protein